MEFEVKVFRLPNSPPPLLRLRARDSFQGYTNKRRLRRRISNRQSAPAGRCMGGLAGRARWQPAMASGWRISSNMAHCIVTAELSMPPAMMPWLKAFTLHPPREPGFQLRLVLLSKLQQHVDTRSLATNSPAAPAFRRRSSCSSTISHRTGSEARAAASSATARPKVNTHHTTMIKGTSQPC